MNKHFINCACLLISAVLFSCNKAKDDSRIITDPPMGDSLSLLTKVYVNDTWSDSITYNDLGQPIAVYYNVNPNGAVMIAKKEFFYDATTRLLNRLVLTRTIGGPADIPISFHPDTIYMANDHYPLSLVHQVTQYGTTDTLTTVGQRYVNYIRYSIKDNNETALLWHSTSFIATPKSFTSLTDTCSYTYDDKVNPMYWIYSNVPVLNFDWQLPESLTLHSRNNITKIVTERKDTVDSPNNPHYAFTTNTTTTIQYTYDQRFGVPLTAAVSTQSTRTGQAPETTQSTMKFEYKRIMY